MAGFNKQSFGANKHKQIKSTFGLLVVFFFLFNTSLKAQILRDTSWVRQVKQCMGDVYNFRFNEAEAIRARIGSAFPDSPVPPLIRGMIIYWKYYPLLPSSPQRQDYEGILKHSIAISEKNAPSPADEAEYLLADLCARGLLMLFYSDNDLSNEVLPEAAGAFHLLKESFKYTTSYPDFCFFTGLYNYYRVKYPEIHPVYRAFALLFPAGDVSKGLVQLQTTSTRGIVLDAEASSFLSGIYSGFEYDYIKSLIISRDLYNKYPGNASYLANYIKYLLFTKQYDEAKMFISSSGNRTDNAFFRAQLLVYEGILKEKMDNDLPAAYEIYRQALTALAPFGDFGNEYAAYCYYGLSRVVSGDKTGDQKRKFRKEANHLAEFQQMNFDK